MILSCSLRALFLPTSKSSRANKIWWCQERFEIAFWSAMEVCLNSVLETAELIAGIAAFHTIFLNVFAKADTTDRYATSFSRYQHCHIDAANESRKAFWIKNRLEMSLAGSGIDSSILFRTFFFVISPTFGTQFVNLIQNSARRSCCRSSLSDHGGRKREWIS